MSNLFEEFDFEEPVYLDTSLCENDNQRFLKERFDSLTRRNELELAMFDPFDVVAYKQVKIHTEQAPEEAEPQLTSLLRQQMLHATGLSLPPFEKQADYITHQVYGNGSQSIVFVTTRHDGVLVPVYCDTDTDGLSPLRLFLLSYARADETARQYRDIAEYRSKIRMKFGLHITDKVLSRHDIESLKLFDAVYDDVQQIEVITQDESFK